MENPSTTWGKCEKLNSGLTADLCEIVNGLQQINLGVRLTLSDVIGLS